MALDRKVPKEKTAAEVLSDWEQANAKAELKRLGAGMPKAK